MPHSDGPVDGVHDRGRLQQRLRRDATPEQAGAAEAIVALDDGDALAELRGTEGGGVPAGARRRSPLRRRHHPSEQTQSTAVAPLRQQADTAAAVPSPRWTHELDAEAAHRSRPSIVALGAKLGPFGGLAHADRVRGRARGAPGGPRARRAVRSHAPREGRRHRPGRARHAAARRHERPVEGRRSGRPSTTSC